MTMARGYLALLLHAHLPYVRHPEYERFLEEGWLFEAITESYLPLLRLFGRLDDEGVPFRLTLSLSPTLLAMLGDPLLQGRYREHLGRLIALAEKELAHTRGDPELAPLARLHLRGFRAALRDFDDRYGGDLVAAFAALQRAGRLELITTAATHGFLPLLRRDPGVIRAQLEVAAASFREAIGEPARGIWLPECGYYPGLEESLAEAGFRWFVVDSHGLLNASERPWHGTTAPLACPNGVAAFGRDPDSTEQVWSAEAGYPGDPWYREFHHDIGFERESEYLAPHLPVAGVRAPTGIKYWRVTGGDGDKLPYQPRRARARSAVHAGHFLGERRAAVARHARAMERPPLLLAPYDAELFGHWWFEGPLWLEQVLRGVAAEGEGEGAEGRAVLESITPGDYLARHSMLQCAQPSASSWGEQGYNAYWLNERTDWIYPHLHRAARAMARLAEAHPAVEPGGMIERALRQAARTLLLAQASDWPFLLRSGSGAEYAERRLRDCLARFNYLERALHEGNIDERRLAALEQLDPIFPGIDYRLFSNDRIRAGDEERSCTS